MCCIKYTVFWLLTTITLENVTLLAFEELFWTSDDLEGIDEGIISRITSLLDTFVMFIKNREEKEKILWSNSKNSTRFMCAHDEREGNSWLKISMF